MPHYFYPIDDELFHQQIEPTLARCRREKNFAGGRMLFEEMLPRIQDFHSAYHGLAGQTLVEQALHGLGFAPATWRAVVGEVLLFAAAELPLLHLSIGALCCLLDRGNTDASWNRPRHLFAPIQQVIHGSRDLVFGESCYRPDFAGYNNLTDVDRLTDFLQEVDPAHWQPVNLTAMKELADDEDRAEELEFVRQSWQDLVNLYCRVREKGQIIVCESD